MALLPAAVRRTHFSRSAEILFLLVLIPASACARVYESPAHAEGNGQAASISVAASDDARELPLPSVVDGRLLLSSGDLPLADALGGGLMGWLGPRVVPSPDGRFVAYNAWRELVPVDPEQSFSDQGIVDGQPLARPSLRIIDTATRTDVLFRDGAFSIAWRNDDTLAYFQGAIPDYRANQPYEGQVFVQDSLLAPPVAWTPEIGRYVVYGWAQGRLLAYREYEGEQLDVLALDGPGQLRVLAPGALILGISPDGSQVLVSEQGGSYVTLFDVSTGNIVAELDLRTLSPALTPTPIDWVMYGGSWVQDTVAAEASSGIALLTLSGSDISLNQVLPLAPNPFPWGVHEPQLVGTTRLAAWAPVPTGDQVVYVYLDCDLGSSSCVERSEQESPAAFAYNPSRPM